MKNKFTVPILLFFLLTFSFLFFNQLVFAGDHSTGTINDIASKVAGKPTLEEIGAQVGKNKIAINFVWVLVTGFLVMFMQAGFAFVETGFTRLKNAAETMMMNFIIYGIGVVGFYVLGFALMFGGVGAIANLEVPHL